MKEFLKSKVGIFLFGVAQAILFAIPFGVFLLIYRETFFTQQTGIGVSGLVILGVIIWVLALAKVLEKMPKFLWFVVLYLLFTIMDCLSGFLKEIGACILLGAVMALPINFIIQALTISGNASLEERSRVKTHRQMRKEKKTKVEVEVE